MLYIFIMLDTKTMFYAITYSHWINIAHSMHTVIKTDKNIYKKSNK